MTQRVIPALSLWQPYASLIAVGLKPYETRGFRAPHRLVGFRIAIHAAKRPIGFGDITLWCGREETKSAGEFKIRLPGATSVLRTRAAPTWGKF